jgi:hypothetical protein
MNVIGKSGSQVLFSHDDAAVIIDVEENIVVSSGKLQALIASAAWDESSVEVDEATSELAYAAISSLDVSIVAAGQRLYTIPKGAQQEAKRALEWRKEHKRGGTPVGLNTARTLAGGGQIGIQKVRHIAKYFPRHEVDKKAEGYSPGEKGFPSNGRIAWALWGGDTAWRWAQAIVERENKKALKADGFATEGYYEDEYDFTVDTRYNAELDAFKSPLEHNLEAVEFIARIRMDGTGIDRLYKMDENYNVQVWDDGFWHSLEGVNSDLASYDLALDDSEDAAEKTHVEIDAESALFLSACFQEDPFAVVSLFDIDQEEASLALDALDELDYEFLDRTLTAASALQVPGEEEGDGDYTPEERSAKAKRQVRDKTGRFAKVGSRVVIGGDSSRIGNIIGIDGPRQSVRVELDSGDVVDVPAVSTQTADSLTPTRPSVTPIQVEELDTRGILGEPRTPLDRPNVQIPGTLPAMDQSDIGNAIGDWNAYVNNMRTGYKPQTTPPPVEKTAPKPVTGPDQIPNIEKSPYLKDLEKLTGITLKFDPYKHPVLERFLNKKVQGSDGTFYYPNKIYYQPVIRGAAAKPGESFEMTPENSDVQPVFFAIVSETDPSAVYELVALVPASSTSNEPMTYTRKDKKWVRQEQILADMKSPTPPPVVPLDAESLKSVIEQVDGVEPVAVSASADSSVAVLRSGNNIMFLTAAGGADRNRGNAEQLRRYWTIGKGGVMKIRWNTPGDWTRCYRNLKKYLGPRAKGYCALRHKEMTGTWPGDKGNIGKRNSFASYDQILEASMLAARANDARIRVMTAGADVQYAEGSKFTIPLVIPEDLESGDGRKFNKEAIEIRELPLPLMWQIKTAEGHNGSVVVGRIDKMERVENGIGNAEGVFDSGAYGQEAERLVREGFIRGVSADLDQFEASQEVSDNQEENAGTIGTDKLVITHARVMAVTLVPKPAFQECQIYLATDEKQEETVIPDGVYTDEMDAVEASALVACGLVAGSIPVVPPRTWFDNPNLDKPTPLTVDDDGRVFGHIAAWHVDHIGMSFGTKPPRSRSNYAYFHTGVVRTDNGTDVPVGQLTLAGGHASLEASAQEAVRHYDDTASAIADVHAGEDAFGIWVSGALRPGTSPEQVRALRASAPSGDWRPVNGRLELVAVCQVNVPGFPIARARVASGAVMALVAAGASVLARIKSDPVADLTARVQKLEQLENAELSAKADAVREKFTALKEAHAAELSARADALYARVFGAQKFDDEFGYISREKRQQLAKKGYALPDGSYPITSVDSLKDSIQAYGRSKPGKRAAVRRHIMKRARQLDRPELIPDKWKSLSSQELGEEVTYLRERIAMITTLASTEVELSTEESDDLGKASAAEFAEVTDVQAGKYVPGKTQPRDAKGKFRQVLARIKQDLGDTGLDRAIEKIEEAENLDDAGNYMEAARAAGDVISIVDRIDARALNPDALENIRTSARALGETIANLPLPFGSDTEKIRYSDLPPALKGLIDDMVSRVEKKIGKDEADKATTGLKSFMSGGDYFSQSEISSEMSKLLRLLT